MLHEIKCKFIAQCYDKRVEIDISALANLSQLSQQFWDMGIDV